MFLNLHTIATLLRYKARIAARAGLPLLAAFLGACAHAPQPAETAAETAPEHGVTAFVLDNGLKLIVQENHRAPVVVAQIWYRVGAGDEYSGITGISHILEHMMFKGTEKYPKKAYTETIKRHGGRDNAFTGRDYTAYFQLFEKSRLPISFDLESDRMTGLLLRQEDFAKEIEVVKEERRWRVDDRPEAQVREQLYAAAFNNAPYHHPIIGWMEDIEQCTLADLEYWYRRWYAPNNATVVVAGDVNPEQVRDLAKQYFQKIPSRPVPVRKPRREAMQQGERRVTVSLPAKQPYLAIGYKTPRAGHAPAEWHPYALSVLAAVLGEGDSSRLSKHLVRGDGIALHASADYDPYTRFDDLFSIHAAPVAGASVETLEQAIQREVKTLQQTPVSDAELASVKARLVAQEVFSRDSIMHQAYLLGSFETIGIGWRELFRLREQIESVTAEQVQAVAAQYLAAKRRTVSVLEPQPLDPGGRGAQ